MRKVILLLLMVFCMSIPDIQAAVRVSIDKLRYEIDLKAHTATVTGLATGLAEEIYDLVIPDFIDFNNEQIPITAIDKVAFGGSTRLKGNLTIGDNVTTIGDLAFRGCSGFTGSLTIPDNVTTIGMGAFLGCSGFTGSLTIPDNVTTIGLYAFSSCSGIESVTCYAIQPPENKSGGAFSYETYKKRLKPYCRCIC